MTTTGERGEAAAASSTPSPSAPAAAPAAPASVDTASVDTAYWRARLAELIDKHRVPGATLGILVDGRIVDAAAGVLSRATRVETTPDAVFQIGSISKVWTATLIMQLVDEGAITLDTPVVRVLPEFAVADPDVTRAVTVRHLLTHTSGIDGDLFTDTGRGDDCLERFAAATASAAVTHPLGELFSYCNTGYSLAGRVIEVLTGTTWDDALRERLIKPLGLTATMTLPEEAILHRAAVGHVGDRGYGQTPTPRWVLPRSAGPAGLILARVHDVLAFARLHLAGGKGPDGTRMLSAAAVREMTERQVELPGSRRTPDGRESWGLGWARFDWGGHEVIGHDGGTIGQASSLRLLPEHGLAVSLLANGGGARALGHELFTEIFGGLAGVRPPEPLTPPAEPVAVDAARYVGRYSRASLDTEVVERDDGSLAMRTTMTGYLEEVRPWAVKRHEQPLVPVGGDDFVTCPEPGSPWEPVAFATLPDGSRYLHHGLRASPRIGGPSAE